MIVLHELHMQRMQFGKFSPDTRTSIVQMLAAWWCPPDCKFMEENLPSLLREDMEQSEPNRDLNEWMRAAPKIDELGEKWCNGNWLQMRIHLLRDRASCADHVQSMDPLERSICIARAGIGA